MRRVRRRAGGVARDADPYAALARRLHADVQRAVGIVIVVWQVEGEIDGTLCQCALDAAAEIVTAHAVADRKQVLAERHLAIAGLLRLGLALKQHVACAVNEDHAEWQPV